jgi:hypothetical protein
VAAVCGDGLRGQWVIYMKRSNYIGSSEKLRKKCLPFKNRVSDAVKGVSSSSKIFLFLLDFPRVKISVTSCLLSTKPVLQ